MNQGQLAAIYTSLVVGVSVSLLFNFCVQDKLYARKLDIRGPEARLYAAMLIGPLLPIGCFIYGWTSYSYLPFVAPCVGLAVISCALFTIYLAATQYVMDAYGPFAASGVASLSIVRNLCAGFWPLFTNTFFDNVGFQLAPTIIGCAAVVFSLTSYVLFFLGSSCSFLSLLTHNSSPNIQARELDQLPASLNISHAQMTTATTKTRPLLSQRNQRNQSNGISLSFVSCVLSSSCNIFFSYWCTGVCDQISTFRFTIIFSRETYMATVLVSFPMRG